MLKLTITPEGAFIYKQIGPAPRKNTIGVVSLDEHGNFYVVVDGKPYKVLLASITYFKVEAGDEVAVILPATGEAVWCAIENVVSKSNEQMEMTQGVLDELNSRKQDNVTPPKKPVAATDDANISDELNDLDFNFDDFDDSSEESKTKSGKYVSEDSFGDDGDSDDSKRQQSIIDEWTPDIAEIEREIENEMKAQKSKE
jgi:hypothetical protein